MGHLTVKKNIIAPIRTATSRDPSLNPIENLFSQFKNHIKNKSPDNYEELKKTIDYIFKNKIKDEHLKNYFNYLFIQANDFINKNS